MSQKRTNAQRSTLFKSARFRLAVILGVLGIIAIGYFTMVGIGNLCAIGFEDFALICPLGALGAMIAQKTLIPQAIISLIFALVVIILFGAFFCSWICPTAALKTLSPKQILRDRRERRSKTDAVAGKSAVQPTCTNASDCEHCAQGCGKSSGVKLDSRHAILGAALLSTLIFSFPIFCLVCPVGLTFAGVLIVMRLFAFGEVTWALIVIPIILAIELIVFPRWCKRICPLGALISLTSGLNKTFRPKINESECLRTTQGSHCDLCTQACPRGIDLHDIAAGETTLNDCIKCRACADVCPTKAITFPFLPSKQQSTVARPALAATTDEVIATNAE